MKKSGFDIIGENNELKKDIAYLNDKLKKTIEGLEFIANNDLNMDDLSYCVKAQSILNEIE